MNKGLVAAVALGAMIFGAAVVTVAQLVFAPPATITPETPTPTPTAVAPTPTPEVEAVSWVSGEWTPTAEYPGPRVGNAAMVYSAGYYYVLGGNTGDGENPNWVPDSYRFDPATNAWTPIAGLPGDEPYVEIRQAGDNIFQLDVSAGDVYLYDADADAWNKLPSPAPIGCVGSVPTDNSLICLDDERDGVRYDLASSTWITLPGTAGGARGTWWEDKLYLIDINRVIDLSTLQSSELGWGNPWIVASQFGESLGIFTADTYMSVDGGKLVSTPGKYDLPEGPPVVFDNTGTDRRGLLWDGDYVLDPVTGVRYSTGDLTGDFAVGADAILMCDRDEDDSTLTGSCQYRPFGEAIPPQA
ncbi:MAG: hypothetical protein LBR58_03345 [Propionibacteriaceae bacterium]|jgi:hypothetical protein|nr:hypothetical protein [Propionibacteriaceae bacterium]